MTNSQILEVAILRAITKGWDCFGYATLHKHHKGSYEVSYDTNHLRLAYWNVGKTREYDSVGFEVSEYEIIFNHDFAKSLWLTQASGEVDPRAVSPSTARPLIPTWQARLMEMVVSDNPLRYLEENII